MQYGSDTFIVLYLLFALFWDSPDPNLIAQKLKSRLRPWVIRAGLSHRWTMYSGPFSHTVEIETRVRYSDGKTEVVELPSRYEFRRYCFMLARQRDRRLFESFARTVESRLVHLDRDPVEITVVRRIAEIPKRTGGFWGHFDVSSGLQFREEVLVKRLLR